MNIEVKKLVDYIKSSGYRYKIARDMLAKLKPKFPEELYKELSFSFRQEKNPNIRNSFAIALQELGDRRALVDLIEAVRNPSTKGWRGTIVYAMSEFNPIEYVYDLVSLVIYDNLETSGNALDIVESLDGNVDEKIYDECVSLINKEINKVSDERKKDLEYLLEMFVE